MAVTVPVPPTGGVACAQPACGVKETNVVPGGSVSVTETLAASPPLLVTLYVYVICVPATTVAGAVFVMARSGATDERPHRPLMVSV